MAVVLTKVQSVARAGGPVTRRVYLGKYGVAVERIESATLFSNSRAYEVHRRDGWHPMNNAVAQAAFERRHPQ